MADTSVFDESTEQSKVKATIVAAAVLAIANVLLPVHTMANQAHDILLKLDNSKRNLALSATLRGESCGSVVRNFFQGKGPYDEAFWNARCANGRSIAADASGSTRVMDCALMYRLTKLKCFKKLSDQK
jgi:hypothetical protein